ncbi:hypothetical protein [Paludisphaera borealis]|uniref:Toxin HigB-2 n=1 Tax=Paludisphaera borealis TaxID=1387353 RepID=A0A1U7CIE8_9BACT|nr:hypothetical protein [Paludisphaera borealis]APW58715.1 Toxin HigB-2 [Paludisphaera borealis]
MPEFDPERWLRFVRFPAFTRDWDRLGLSGEDLRQLELVILENPTRPPVVQGTGGLRKIRFAGRGSARGKSGAYRVCYVVYPDFGVIALVVVFGKKEKDDLSPADRRAVAVVIGAFREELEAEFRRDQARDPGQEQGGR